MHALGVGQKPERVLERVCVAGLAASLDKLSTKTQAAVNNLLSGGTRPPRCAPQGGKWAAVAAQVRLPNTAQKPKSLLCKMEI